MSIEELRDSIHVQGEICEAPYPAEWHSLEAQIKLPTDYKQFLSLFGTGVLAEFFYVWNPFSNVQGMNWLAEHRKAISDIETLMFTASDLYRDWILFPQKNGLLPWGKTGNGDLLFWTTSGTPDHWGIAVSDGSPDMWKSTENLSSFLWGSLAVTNYCPQLPNLADRPKTFIPLAI
jgi:hypothetical protein